MRLSDGKWVNARSRHASLWTVCQSSNLCPPAARPRRPAAGAAAGAAHAVRRAGGDDVQPVEAVVELQHLDAPGRPALRRAREQPRRVRRRARRVHLRRVPAAGVLRLHDHRRRVGGDGVEGDRLVDRAGAQGGQRLEHRPGRDAPLRQRPRAQPAGAAVAADAAAAARAAGRLPDAASVPAAEPVAAAADGAVAAVAAVAARRPAVLAGAEPAAAGRAAGFAAAAAHPTRRRRRRRRRSRRAASSKGWRTCRSATRRRRAP